MRLGRHRGNRGFKSGKACGQVCDLLALLLDHPEEGGADAVVGDAGEALGALLVAFVGDEAGCAGRFDLFSDDAGDAD